MQSRRYLSNILQISIISRNLTLRFFNGLDFVSIVIIRIDLYNYMLRLCSELVSEIKDISPNHMLLKDFVSLMFVYSSLFLHTKVSANIKRAF